MVAAALRRRSRRRLACCGRRVALPRLVLGLRGLGGRRLRLGLGGRDRPLAAALAAGRALDLLLGADGDAGAVIELGEARRHHPLARVDPVGEDGADLVLLGHRDRPHRDRVVVVRDVDEGPVGAALDGRGRHHGRVLERIDQELHVDELARPELQALVGEFRLELHGAGGLVDLVVDDDELAVVDHGAVVVGERLRIERALGEGAVDRGQFLLRQSEDDRDRPDLGDHHDPGGVGRMNDVAGVDEPQPGAAGDRRDDAGVGEHRLGVLDRALIRLHLRLELSDQRLLGVVLLAARRVRRGQLGVAVEIDARVAEQGFVHRPLGDRLVELGAIDGGVDVGEDEALLDVLAFLEIHRDQLAVDLGAHGHDVERAARPDAVEIDRDVLLGRRGREHRNRRVGDCCRRVRHARLCSRLASRSAGIAGHRSRRRHRGRAQESRGARRCGPSIVPCAPGSRRPVGRCVRSSRRGCLPVRGGTPHPALR